MFSKSCLIPKVDMMTLTHWAQKIRICLDWRRQLAAVPHWWSRRILVRPWGIPEGSGHHLWPWHRKKITWMLSKAKDRECRSLGGHVMCCSVLHSMGVPRERIDLFKYIASFDYSSVLIFRKTSMSFLLLFFIPFGTDFPFWHFGEFIQSRLCLLRLLSVVRLLFSIVESSLPSLMFSPFAWTCSFIS